MIVNFRKIVKWWNEKSDLNKALLTTAIPFAYVAYYILSDILDMLKY